MSAAAAAITGGFQPGDMLFLTGFGDSDGDGFLDGTSIAFTQVSATELRFEGLDTIERYQDVLNGVRYDNLTNPTVGVREVTLTVTDDQGATSQPFTVRIDIQDQLIAGDENANTLTGTEAGDAISGRGGDDVLSGLGGDDLIDGGAGDDQIFGGAGSDILFGGTGRDLIFGGEGADRIVIGSLVFGTTTVGDFNQPDGDRLDLSQMFAGSNPFIPDDQQYQPGLSIDAQYFQLADVGGGTLQLSVDLDGPGTAFDFQAVANLDNPVGVTTATPIQDIVITQPQQGSDGATS
jgi:Ca2+-binding RTX toxin-like protein